MALVKLGEQRVQDAMEEGVVVQKTLILQAHFHYCHCLLQSVQSGPLHDAAAPGQEHQMGEMSAKTEGIHCCYFRPFC